MVLFIINSYLSLVLSFLKMKVHVHCFFFSVLFSVLLELGFIGLLSDLFPNSHLIYLFLLTVIELL